MAELGQLISGKTDWALWLNDHSIATQNSEYVCRPVSFSLIYIHVLTHPLKHICMCTYTHAYKSTYTCVHIHTLTHNFIRYKEQECLLVSDLRPNPCPIFDSQVNFGKLLQLCPSVFLIWNLTCIMLSLKD